MVDDDDAHDLFLAGRLVNLDVWFFVGRYIEFRAAQRALILSVPEPHFFSCNTGRRHPASEQKYFIGAERATEVAIESARAGST
jgi:hypothetical protein